MLNPCAYRKCQPIPCPICPQAFDKFKKLEQHVVQAHSRSSSVVVERLNSSTAVKSTRKFPLPIKVESSDVSEEPGDDDDDDDDASSNTLVLLEEIDTPTTSKNAKIRCPICPNMKFKTLQSLEDHTQATHAIVKEDESEEADEKHECPECFKCFKELSNLQSHRLTVHSVAVGRQRKLQLHCCSRRFPNMASYNEHKRLKHGSQISKYFDCKSCCKRFSTYRALATHSRSKRHRDVLRKKRSFNISYESQDDSRPTNSKRRRSKTQSESSDSSENEENSWSLETVRRKATRREHANSKALRRRVTRTKSLPSFDPSENQPLIRSRLSQGLTFKCHHCDRKFSTNRARCVHIRWRHQQKNASSSNTKNANGKPQRSSSESNMSDKLEDKLKCRFCSMTFFNPPALKKHITWKHPNKKVTWKVDLSDSHHQQPIIKKRGRPPKINKTNEERGPKSLRCCSKQFESQLALMIHKGHAHKNRDSGGAYKCAYCVKTFDTASGLAEHNKHKHKELKRAFKPGSVKAKLAQCRKCGLSYSCLDGLRRHYKIVHESQQKLVTCRLCRGQFKSKNALKGHMTMRH